MLLINMANYEEKKNETDFKKFLEYSSIYLFIYLNCLKRKQLSLTIVIINSIRHTFYFLF
jgi:hypothetical protein